MTRIFFGKMLANEDVPQMSAAVCALDFSSFSIRVRQSFNGTRNFIVKAWPTAVCFKLVLRTVQFFAAAFANVSSFIPKRVVLACEGHFCALVNYDLVLFGGKLFEVGLFFRSRQ